MRKLLIAFSLLLAAGIVASGGEEVTLLFNSWLEGKPKALVRISVETPKSEEEFCFVAVHRFPSRFNPTENGTSEIVYRGVVPCGSKVVVKDLINMIQVGVKRSGEEIRPVYDSPEYAVIVVSKNGSFTKIVQSNVVKPVTEINVKAELKRGYLKVQKAHSTACEIDSNPDSCVVDTKLAYVNSIPGLKVAFGLRLAPQSVMYLESWGSSCYSYDQSSSCPSSSWQSMGKKRVVSLVGELSDFVSDGKRAVIWGDVMFKYERYAYWDENFGGYWKYEFFYPTSIMGLSMPEIIGDYNPKTPPNYAAGPFKGDREIGFEDTYKSNTKLGLTTYVGLTIGTFSIGVSISPYKAGDSCTTPYVSVVDVSGKNRVWYYWWYKNNDPMNYEIEFYGN